VPYGVQHKDDGAIADFVSAASPVEIMETTEPSSPAQACCTPWLIWFLEHAARNAVLPLLEPGEGTVGVVINVEHTAATPLGAQVVCRARVIYADGPLILFQLEAHDEHEKIARGTHKLRVIEAARLAKTVQKKTR